MSKITVLETEIADFLKRYDAIEAAYLFGSAVTGTMRADSDIDLALLLNVDNPHAKQVRDSLRVEIAADLASTFAAVFDVGILDSRNLIYAAQVLFTGTQLFSKNPNRTALYTTSLLGMYCNFSEERKEIVRGFTH